MSRSDSDCDSQESFFTPAVLKRPKVANHVVHESFTVDTRDHEDHTFCGVMFDVRCKAGGDDRGAPVEFLEVVAVSVRGFLGPLTVWTTPESYKGKEHQEDLWELVYEREHSPSRQHYQQLEFTKPVRLKPGYGCGLYVHSKLPGDNALVYDNRRSHLTYEDEAFQVYPGLAHLSNRPFGRRGMWGFPWRDNREFVGRIQYGVGYILWNPEVHHKFPVEFRNAVKTCLLCARRRESPLNLLQDDVVFYILNMCKYDWFSDGTRRRSAGSHEGYPSNRTFSAVPERLGLLLSHPSRFPAGVPAHMQHFRPDRGLDLPDGSSDSDSEDGAWIRRITPTRPGSSSLRDASGSSSSSSSVSSTGEPGSEVGALQTSSVSQPESVHNAADCQ